MTDKEFAAILGIGQILPGPNTMNAAVMLGDRFQGSVRAALGEATLLLLLSGGVVVQAVWIEALGRGKQRRNLFCDPRLHRLGTPAMNG